MKRTDDSNRYEIRVVTRAIQVLLCFVQNGPELTVDQIAASVRLPKSTVYRLLVTLEENGFVERGPQREAYRLGNTALLVGTAALGQMDMHKKIRSHLEELMHASGETVHLAVLGQDRAVIVDKIDSFHSIRMASTIGFHSPLHCTGVGKVLLAFADDAERTRLLSEIPLFRRTPNTIVDVDQLAQELAQIRSNGYALDREEIELGLHCVAAPLRDYTGKVVASISLSGPTSRINEQTIPRFIELIRKSADKMSQALGYRDGVTNLSM